MLHVNTFLNKKNIAILLSVLLLVVALIAFEEYRRRVLFKEIDLLNDSLQVEKIDKVGLEIRINDLENKITEFVDQNTSALSKIEENNNKFQEKIGEINNTVSELDKLTKADEELLKKYSKTYFLNEHYVPVELTEIEKEYIFEDKILKIHADVWPFLKDLLDEARDDDIDLGVASAFRDFGSQSILKSAYRFTYGTGTANQFSAEQGYSEHQLGTTVDFANSETFDSFAGFDKTKEYEWLTENAHRFGFILSYPKDNPYYQYEPWHWRFVGVDLADRLRDEDINFYDFDQREINNYLVNLFD